jgi:hypothetical protein
VKIIKVYKEKQYLIFDFEDGRNVKYDFATKEAIGIKGKPVKGLQSQLSGISMNQIIENCSDEKYAKFLKYVKERESRNWYEIYNIGTILNRVPKYSNYEQLFSAGIDEILDSRNVFKYTINDIPKGLVKLCKDRKIKLSNNFLQYYKENPDAYILAYNLEYMSLTDDDIYDILSYEGYDYAERDYIYYSYYNKLINEYGYTSKALLLYIDGLKTYEALENMSSILREIYDYANMMKAISDKFDKYPRNFLTTHKIACRNYDRLKKEFSEEMFKKRIDKSLECSYGNYKIIYPESTQDIKDEAVQQNNCVASYIDRVINGECHILFLRSKTDPKNSLVTLEVRNGKIVQAKRKFNQDLTDEQQEIVNKYNNKNEKEKIAC